MSNPARILVVEDHPQILEAIVRIVSGTYEVAGKISRGDEVVKAALLLQPEVILLDISLPGRSGIQVLPELRTQLPEAGIIMLTNHIDPGYRAAALEHGADAYVDKGKAVQDLLPAISETLEGRMKSSHPLRNSDQRAGDRIMKIVRHRADSVRRLDISTLEIAIQDQPLYLPKDGRLPGSSKIE